MEQVQPEKVQLGMIVCGNVCLNIHLVNDKTLATFHRRIVIKDGTYEVSNYLDVTDGDLDSVIDCVMQLANMVVKK